MSLNMLPVYHSGNWTLGTDFFYFASMPRTHRIEFPGALVHITTRGLDGMSLFVDDKDREFFLSPRHSGVFLVTLVSYKVLRVWGRE